MPGIARLGKPPASTNAGRRFPPEVLTDAEVRALMDACGDGLPSCARNRALIAVLYRGGLGRSAWTRGRSASWGSGCGTGPPWATFTACTIAYRLIKVAGAKRILFLVDRNNLCKQTLNEFQQFASPYNAYKFTEEYGVQHLKKSTIDPAAKVCITTIQRLYSILKGEEDLDESAEEGSMFEAVAEKLIKQPLPVVYNEKIPPGFFDFIIVDECHRSIYNVWRQVIEYFDAFLIGLTATPSAQTIGFFNGNLVMEYTHEEAVLDGVNVGYDVYRIETRVVSGLRDGPDSLNRERPDRHWVWHSLEQK